MMKVLKKIQSILSSVLLCIVVIVLLALVAVRLFGVQTYIVLSGSMEDVYPTGSLICVNDVDYRTLAVGDAITYRLDKTFATHRIYEIIPDEADPASPAFRMKGDENEEPDGGLVHPDDIVGKPFLCIPYVGYAVNYLQHPPGIYIMVTVCVVALIFAFLPTGKSGQHDEDGTESESDS